MMILREALSVKWTYIISNKLYESTFGHLHSHHRYQVSQPTPFAAVLKKK